MMFGYMHVVSFLSLAGQYLICPVCWGDPILVNTQKMQENVVHEKHCKDKHRLLRKIVGVGGVNLYIVRYLILWLAFIILFSAGALGLEWLEGYKITTTEYYGLRNIGFIFIILMFLTASVLYPLVLLPLSIVIGRIVTVSWLRVLLYFCLGGIGGRLIFHLLYDDRFIREYDLNMVSSILIFGTIGVIYALLDHDLRRRQSLFVKQSLKPK
ncbi:hypothetical protein [Paenibacillus abyssi]|nr:hypothetical protein [Paenibacillus abyssi]